MNVEISNKPLEDLTYEQALAELERIVSVLEVEEQTLEDAISLYARGQDLTTYCAQLLEKAELRVRTIDEAGSGADES